MMRQYPSYVAPAGSMPPPTIEARRQPPPERVPGNVMATLIELAVVALAWAGLVMAGFLAVEMAQSLPLSLWALAVYAGLITFLVVFCIWATLHYHQQHQMRGRDLRAWEELEADYARIDEARKRALADNQRLRVELAGYQVPINTGPPKKAAQYQADASAVESEPAPAPMTQVLSKARQRYEDHAREIVRRFELGITYKRGDMVADGYSASVWNRVMGDIKKKKFAVPQGHGGELYITAFRGGDVLRALRIE